MESMRKTMIHNDTRAKVIRFSQMETLRSMIRSEDRPELPDSFVTVHFSIRRGGSRDYESNCVVVNANREVAAGTELLEAFKTILEIRRDGREIDQPLLASQDTSNMDEIRITAVSLVTGLNSKDVTFHTDAENDPADVSSGTMIQTTFVDDSFSMFIVEESGMVNFTASTHELPVESYKLKRDVSVSSSELKSFINEVESKNNLKLENSDSIGEKLEDQAYLASIILSASSATQSEFELIW